MSLITRLARQVTRKSQIRGRGYYLGGRVEIAFADADSIEARVRGGALYQVRLARAKEGISVACSCPYYDEWFQPCKHIWASFLTADREGLLSSWADVRPTLILDEHEPDNVSQGDEDLPASFSDPPDRARAPRPRLSSSTTPGPVPAWKRAMEEIRQSGGNWPSPPAVAAQESRLLYVIDAETAKQRGLCVETATHRRKKNGDWSKPKSFSVGHDNLHELSDPADRRIVAHLLGAPRGPYYSTYSTRESSFRIIRTVAEELLPLMCATGRCMFRRSAGDPLLKLRWEDGPPWEFRIEVCKDADSAQYVASGCLHRAGGRVPLSEPLLLFSEGLMILGDLICCYDHRGAFGWIVSLRRTGTLAIPEGDKDSWLREALSTPVLPPLDLPAELRFEQITLVPQARLKVFRCRNYWTPDELQAELLFDYEGRIVSRADQKAVVVDAERRRRIDRNQAFEAAAEEQLLKAGFRAARDYSGKRTWFLAARKLGPAVRALVPLGWTVEAEGKLYRKPGAFNLSVRTGIDWFELHGVVDFEGRPVALPDLLEALRKGENTVALGDGTIGMIPEEWLRRYGILTGLGTPDENCLRFSRTQLGVLDALLAAQPEVACDARFEQARAQLNRFAGVQPADAPPGFKGRLRPYQREGLGWIHFLREFGFGGCLADDMGLGKTIQVLALLEARRVSGNGPSAKDPEPRPSLLVVPKTLVFNWKQEAARFTPELRILDHTGGLRIRAGEHFDGYHAVLTTYGTLRRDAQYLKDVRFDYVILDESQAVKNADTISAKAVRLLQARHRLALSGTPIENHLGELWSLFEFLNPGMLGSASVFRLGEGELRNPDEEARRLLSRALRPFILRRTKQQVAADLPPKQEQTLFCELETLQRRLYNELREYYRNSLLAKVSQQGMGKAKIQVLEALLRLRQAACHPGLIDKKRTSEASAKLDLLLPQIDEVLETGHKVLVFSQFTSFLAIVRERLDRGGVRYEYLDGATRDRAAPVERFQNDPNCPLFLISLRAGGLGLNLTAAEYVYLLDPWWNPAVEAQAIDRTHRIGQTRPVFAYRIIARDTVEEKVLELQETKRDLAEAIIGEDRGLIRNLTRDDLELLLS